MKGDEGEFYILQVQQLPPFPFTPSMSSFKRAPTATSSAAPPGTRRWLDGQCLVSTGSAGLDAALGGGIPLGSLVLLEDDACGAGHGALLASLFAAEGLACGHGLIVAGGDGRVTPQGFVEGLPLCVSRGSGDLAALAAGQGASVRKPTDSREGEGNGREGEGGGDTEDPEEELGGEAWDVSGKGLQNAWQYKKYLPGAATTGTAAAGGGEGGATAPPPTPQKYCHTFDLGKRIPAVSLAKATIATLPCVTIPSGASELLARAQCIAAGGVGVSGVTPTTSTSHYKQREEDARTLSTAAALLAVGLQAGVGEGSPPSPHSFYHAMVDSISSHLVAPKSVAAAAAPQPQQPAVQRVVVLGLGGAGWPGCTGSDAFTLPRLPTGPASLPSHTVLEGHLGMLKAVAALKRTILSSALHLVGSGGGGGGGSSSPPTPAIAYLVCPTWAMPLAVAHALRARCDVVLKLHAFKDPAYALMGGAQGASLGAPLSPSPEFGSATGLLLFRRLPQWGSAAPPSLPDTLTWLFTRGRRKLDISRPHPPPEKEEVKGGGEGGGPQLSCSSSGGGGSGSTDF